MIINRPRFVHHSITTRDRQLAKTNEMLKVKGFGTEHENIHTRTKDNINKETYFEVVGTKQS